MTPIRTQLKPRWLRPQLIPAVMVLAGLVLRLFRLGQPSFWFDEAQTLTIARLPYAEIAQRAYRPPLYHMLLHLWGQWGPESEFWLRLPSALLGGLVPLLAYLVAARLYGRRTGILAAGLTAIAPALVRYAQELRMYSLLSVEFLLLMLLSLKVLGTRARPAVGVWGLFWLVEAASLYTHYFAIPFIAWLVATCALFLLLARRWRALAALGGAQLAVLLAFIPWLLMIRGGQGGTSDYLSAEPVPVVETAGTVRDFLRQTWDLYTTELGPTVARAPVLGYLPLVAGALLGLATLILLAGAARWVWGALHEVGPHPGPLPMLGEGGGKLARGSRSMGEGEDISCPLPSPEIGRGPDASERRVGRGEGGWGDAYLLALLLGPLATAAAMYWFRPGVVHPRHLMMIAGPWMILIARAVDLGCSSQVRGRPPLAWLRILGRTLGSALLAAFVGMFLIGLGLLYRGAAYARPDVRGLARHIASITTAHDRVLLPYVDHALEYYYHGEAKLYYVETRVGDVDLLDWFLPLIQGAQRAVLLNWVHIFADGRDLLPWFLQMNGRLVAQDWEAERRIRVYELSNPLRIPTFAPANVRFGPLRLKGAALMPQAVADQPVSVALQWELLGPTTENYRASVRVLDPAGRMIAQADRVLLSEKTLAPTGIWPVGLSARNYYAPEPPTGTPPISHTLTVSVYSDKGPVDVLNAEGRPTGTVYELGSFRVELPAAFPETFPAGLPMTRIGREVLPGLRLEGFALDGPTARSGDALGITLYWKALAAPLPAQQPQLRLVSPSGQALGAQSGAPAYGRLPLERWRTGQLLADRRTVPVSAEAEAGPARLELVFEGAAPLLLQEVTVEKTDRRFTLPPVQYPLNIPLGNVARLRGYDLLKPTLTAGESFSLTLYWEATNAAPLGTSYAAFTHLLDAANQVIAQHDGLPGAGRWPTTAWVKGQIVVDPHELAFKNADYRGEAVLEVGLYDAATFERLRTPGGEDRILLGVKVIVQPK